MSSYGMTVKLVAEIRAPDGRADPALRAVSYRLPVGTVGEFAVPAEVLAGGQRIELKIPEPEELARLTVEAVRCLFELAVAIERGELDLAGVVGLAEGRFDLLGDAECGEEQIARLEALRPSFGAAAA